MNTPNTSLLQRIADSLRRKNITRIKILLILELFGIILLVWQFKTPIYKKMFTAAPKAYDLASFNSQKTYLLSENDFIVGKTSPDSKIKLILVPGPIKITTTPNQEGRWYVNLPENIPYQKYSLILAYYDKDSKLTQVSTFKIRVQSENVFIRSNLYKQRIKPLLPFDLEHIL